jgi:hypothetical protein
MWYISFVYAKKTPSRWLYISKPNELPTPRYETQRPSHIHTIVKDVKFRKMFDILEEEKRYRHEYDLQVVRDLPSASHPRIGLARLRHQCSSQELKG